MRGVYACVLMLILVTSTAVAPPGGNGGGSGSNGNGNGPGTPGLPHACEVSSSSQPCALANIIPDTTIGPGESQTY